MVGRRCTSQREMDQVTGVFNEAASIGAAEAVDDDTGTQVTYVATDDDNTDAAPSTDGITYSLEGADNDKFRVDPSTGQLTKLAGTDVDFETKSEYSIIVLATSRRGTGPDFVDMYDRVSVTVKVKNTNDEGTVSLSQRDPQVGKSVTASIDDVDGDVGYVEWQWYRLTDTDAMNDERQVPDTTDVGNACSDEAVGEDSCYIGGAASASYTVTSNDVDRFLMARASYVDKFNTNRKAKTVVYGVSDADVQIEDAANTAPEFNDQDRNTPGVQDETVTREVKENTGAETNIGEGFTATDGDDDLLMYVLGGPERRLVRIDRPGERRQQHQPADEGGSGL